jgi:taurine dioxygenase
MTDEQRKRRPPVVYALFLAHPITGQKVLYSNEGCAVRINELPQAESGQTLDYLFRHQLLNQFRFEFDWNENDLLIWDHFRTIRRAIADHGPGEIRLMRRCQAMASNVFDPAFPRPAREAGCV